VSAVATRGLLVGVDFGTSTCKAGVVGLDGHEVAHGRVAVPWRRVATGAEMDPEAFVDTALAAIAEALDAAGGGQVLGLGVTSMAETGVLLDAAGMPVAPAIAWHDDRGGEEARRIADELGADRFTEHTGLSARPLCSISKYLWLRDHHEGTASGRRWLNVSEWIVHRLGARQSAELSLASRTGWLDLGSRTWWNEALALCDVAPGFLPDLVQAGTHLGTASNGPAWLDGAALTVAGHDHLCGAVGAGALADDVVYDSCGTAEAFIGQMVPSTTGEQVRRLVARGINVGWHVVPDRHALLGAQRAGLGLQRFLDLLGVGHDGVAALDAAALAAPVDAGGLAVTDIDGEVAALTGIGRSPDPGQVWRAALNAVATRAAEILHTIESERGAVRQVVVAGGWARSAAFRAVKREHQGAFHHADGVVEAGVRGAALLGGLAAGVFDRLADLPSPDGAPVGAGSTGESERQRAGGRGATGEGERQRAGGRGATGGGDG
jgi:sugar (pentulose or hexulose) kinase